MFNISNEKNLSLLVDIYELTMSNNLILNNKENTIVCFDMFFRNIPDNGGYCIMAGLDQFIEYIKNIKFHKSDINFLRNKNLFDENFLSYLQNFKFSCDIFAIEEGYPIFPKEPIITVRGPIIECLLIETMLLLTLNHQILIATKSSRICTAANNRPVLEFGARRAQGYDAAIYGARAAIIGGCIGTSCTISEKIFGIHSSGTMAHSWIQMFDSEYEAFKTWAIHSPNNCTFLIDTYNVLKSGLPNAIRVFKEILEPLNIRPKGIRIDSGDITYLTKKVRKTLNNSGFSDVKIIVSNSLDENIISNVLAEGAEIDIFGVGERLITSKSEPVLGGVYKLSGIYKNDILIPKIKISENEEKITIPGLKTIYRIFDKQTNMAIADLITNFDEIIDESKSLTLFDPTFTWKKKNIKNFYAIKLHKQIFHNGNCIYKSPTVNEIQNIKNRELKKIWPETIRIENPQPYFVDLSKDLWELRQNLLNKHSNEYM